MSSTFLLFLSDPPLNSKSINAGTNLLYYNWGQLTP
jgi:hypothetical protein